VTTRRAVLALLAISGLAAACGAGAGPAAGPERKPQTHTVTIDATSYQPKNLVVHAGDTVVWVNKDFIPHTATAKGGTFDSTVIAAGSSWTYTAANKGVTDYACTFHPTMIGTLEVQ
jgi:plastocyanin